MQHGFRTGGKMLVKYSLVAASALGMLLGSAYSSHAQQPAATPPRPVGGFVPGQKRPAIDPAIVARGKVLYGINCQGCHGPDLRGGDMGGPNLLRSQVALSDLDGELIVPIIQGARQSRGMPAIGLSIADSKIVAAYVRSVIATIGVQGTPPGAEKPLNIVVGNAAEGEKYFSMKCKSCHSAEGDLRGIGSRFSDPKALQNLWVAGGIRGANSTGSIPEVTVTPPVGKSVEGQLVRIDDFLVTLKLSDGTSRTFRRNGNIPKVVLRDPLKAHRDLLPVYTDKEMHDVTAYLVTLK
ncbi:MAG: c-type cytochrome [Granulicella sp.]